jgi:hypothetical protein
MATASAAASATLAKDAAKEKPSIGMYSKDNQAQRLLSQAKIFQHDVADEMHQINPASTANTKSVSRWFTTGVTQRTPTGLLRQAIENLLDRAEDPKPGLDDVLAAIPGWSSAHRPSRSKAGAAGAGGRGVKRQVPEGAEMSAAKRPRLEQGAAGSAQADPSAGSGQPGPGAAPVR